MDSDSDKDNKKERILVGEEIAESKYDQLSEGWSFSEFVHVHLDRLTKCYSLILVEGRKPLFKLNKYDITDSINAIKLMRLEESERKKQYRWTIF